MTVDDVRAELPGWKIVKGKAGHWHAYSPAFDLDGVCILAGTADEVIDRVRIHVQICALARGDAGRERPPGVALLRVKGPARGKAPAAPVAPSGRNPIADRSTSKAAGFEGDPCQACGAWMLVRNGSCLKCVSCGTTTGCS